MTPLFELVEHAQREVDCAPLAGGRIGEARAVGRDGEERGGPVIVSAVRVTRRGSGSVRFAITHTILAGGDEDQRGPRQPAHERGCGCCGRRGSR